MKYLIVLCAIFITPRLLATPTGSGGYTSRTCAYNKDTKQFFDLKSIPPEKRMEAYKQYLEDLKKGKYEQKPCPDETKQKVQPEEPAAATS